MCIWVERGVALAHCIALDIGVSRWAVDTPTAFGYAWGALCTFVQYGVEGMYRIIG
jgi:hypothetical protein